MNWEVAASELLDYGLVPGGRADLRSSAMRAG